MDYLAIAERLGIPFVCILAMALAIWQAVRWFAKSIVQPLIKAHINYLNETVAQGKENTQTMKEILGSQKELVSDIRSVLPRIPGFADNGDNGIPGHESRETAWREKKSDKK
jgi:hypothetical protein